MSAATVAGRTWRWGRSRTSVMLIAGSDVHLFVWWPRLGTDSYGATVRRRRGDAWGHYRLIAMQRNKRENRFGHRNGGLFRARRTLTIFELSHWHTQGGTQERSDELKAYLRLKASAGGRHLPRPSRGEPS